MNSKYDLASLTIGNLLKEINSPKPLPSAGSSVSVVAAIGVSLMGMAIKISAKKNKEHPPVEEFLEKIDLISKQLLNLGEKDIENLTLVFAKNPALSIDSDEVKSPIIKMSKILNQVLNEYKDSYYSWSYPPVRGDADAGIIIIKSAINVLSNLN